MCRPVATAGTRVSEIRPWPTWWPGKFPADRFTSGDHDQRGMRFSVQDYRSADRDTTIASLRHAVPAEGIEDIVVAGKSWKLAASEDHLPTTRAYEEVAR
jgi:hypothetical protein